MRFLVTLLLALLILALLRLGWWAVRVGSLVFKNQIMRPQYGHLYSGTESVHPVDGLPRPSSTPTYDVVTERFLLDLIARLVASYSLQDVSLPADLQTFYLDSKERIVGVTGPSGSKQKFIVFSGINFNDMKLVSAALAAKQHMLPPYSYDGLPVGVAEVSFRRFDRFCPSLLAAFRKVIEPGDTVYLVGYSHGSRYVDFFLYRQLLSHLRGALLPDVRFIAYTFGAPATGSAGFARLVNEFPALAGYHRVFNTCDLTPSYPIPVQGSSKNGRLFDYTHAGTPQAFTKQMMSLTQNHMLLVYLVHNLESSQNQ
eukprot:gnl/Hemi2/28598_TR9479_c0_g1_i1.p1 gnl/Hemi2/28598_TR9479_c0_g1~~gnl/Hemi2/28598_TR9479_c0_g1_i1.p1  ORF type:complete len:323 (+),score=42.73 gnl/Hemi2/28598_TR9479_c0_g1_i1:32-970(+)